MTVPQVREWAKWASERTSERSRGRKRSRQSGASKQVSGANERANGRASGPVLQSVFLVDLAHSAVLKDRSCSIYWEPNDKWQPCQPAESNSRNWETFRHLGIGGPSWLLSSSGNIAVVFWVGSTHSRDFYGSSTRMRDLGRHQDNGGLWSSGSSSGSSCSMALWAWCRYVQEIFWPIADNWPTGHRSTMSPPCKDRGCGLGKHNDIAGFLRIWSRNSLCHNSEIRIHSCSHRWCSSA